MAAKQIPAAKTHEQGLKPRQRFESYRTAAGPLCDAQPIRGESAEDAQCEGWYVDDLLVCRTSYSPTMFRRTARQAREGGGFLLQINFSGEQVGEVDGHPLQMTEERLVLQDIARPYTSMGHVHDSAGVLIPRHRIQGHEALYRRRPVIDFPVASPQGQILLHTFHAFLGVLRGLPQANAAEVATGFVGLLNGFLSTGSGPLEGSSVAEQEAVEIASLDAMKAYLVRHLHEPKLTPEILCKIFHCSRAKIYRLFSEDGGVAAFIREKRLAKSFESLHNAAKDGTVQGIAERWGFQDPYHFSKLFKKTFGVPPSEVLCAATSMASLPEREDGSKDGGRAIRNWVLGAMDSHQQLN